MLQHDKNCRAALSVILSGFILCYGTIFNALSLPAAPAKGIELHGLKPGMNFKAVLVHLKNKWPKATITPKYKTITHASQSYRFGTNIVATHEAKDRRENINIQFSPPASITRPEASSTLKHIQLNTTPRNNLTGSDKLKDKLTGKYGPPTLIEDKKQTWLFDAKKNLIERASFERETSTKQRACTNIKLRQKNMLRMSAANEKTTAQHKKILAAIAKQLTACEKTLAKLKNCHQEMSNKLCPYILTYSWHTREGQVDEIKNLSARLFAAPQEKLDLKNLKTLKAQLQKQARSKTTVKPKSKPEPKTKQKQQPAEEPLPSGLINF